MTIFRLPPLLPLAWLMVMLAVHAAAWAEPSSPTEPATDQASDYSHSLTLTVSGTQGVVAFPLPEAVYRHSRSATLSDLRLFDTAGAKLLFTLMLPEAEKPLSWPVKQFPFYAPQAANQADALELDIKTQSDGSLLSVQTKWRGRASNDKAGKPPLAGLVLDLGQPKPGSQTPLKKIQALRFELPPGLAPYTAQIWLEVSDNLTQWATLAATELTWLTDAQGEGLLTNDRLGFNPQAFRYARLTWRSGPALRFAAITAEGSEPQAAPQAYQQMTVQALPGKKAGDWQYPVGVAFPVEKIDMHFGEANVVLPAQIGTYREPRPPRLGNRDEWVFQPHAVAVFYQITQGKLTRRSGEQPIPTGHFADWVIRPQTPAPSQTELTVAWQPAKLVFLAGGVPPYTLAFGRDGVKSAALALAQVAPGFSQAELAQLEQAQAGAVQSNAAADRANERALQAAQQRTRWLWAALALGVLALGGMAWQLYRQIAQTAKP